MKVLASVPIRDDLLNGTGVALIKRIMNRNDMTNNTAAISSTQLPYDNRVISWLFFGLFLTGLCLTSLYSYPVFHTLAETFSIIIACGVFALAWNTRQYLDENYLLLIGIISLCSGVIDMFHMMAYKGVALFAGYDNNLPTSLWIAARYLQSSVLFTATLRLSRRAESDAAPSSIIPVFWGCGVITTLLVWSVFTGFFPVCWIEGTGLTPFKKESEVVISALFIGSDILLWRCRARFNPDSVRLLLGSFAVAACAEIAFIFFVDLFGISNLLGHVFKIISYYLLYRAIIKKGLQQPMTLMFQQLRTNNAELETEITGRKRMEEALVAREQEFRALAENAPDPIIRYDRNGRRIYVNPATERISGKPADILLGHSPSEGMIVPSPEGDIIVSWVRRVSETGMPVEGEIEIVAPDGETRCFYNRYVPEWGTDGAVASILSISSDITALKRTEKELQARNSELERFTYTVSHDLKSPLVTIKSFSGSIRNDLAANRHDRLDKDLNRIGSAADKMAALLDDLLKLSRIGHIINTPEPVDMALLADDVLNSMAGTLKEHNVQVSVHPGLPTVLCDRQRMMEVVQNLIENAVKYRGDQPEPRIVIGQRINCGRQVFFVHDNGPGIEPKYHENIFGLFNRLDTHIPGTGIGLALVKRIIEVHGGSIWVESDGQGNGSAFCFTVG